jgi:hypothetical protein
MESGQGTTQPASLRHQLEKLDRGFTGDQAPTIRVDKLPRLFPFPVRDLTH